eukprot:TRINITY_DN20695_c0_g1_i1.p1 TRINITY_DN20695_c0_g1~~TRINITY_DN20695_c0_g1_i1.p1  ORF type:complete len:228 (+),score=23.35 TRINITY_DN20695_c0_g1_i1:63-746(+)
MCIRDRPHAATCPPCERRILKSCNCGLTEDFSECTKELTCNNICNKFKSCKVHRCKRACCKSFKGLNDPEGHHLCLTICGKPLACGHHSCDLFCHLGNCPPCAVYENTIACACGKSTIAGRFRCPVRPPQCQEICNKELACGHRCPTLCHPDACDPCYEFTEKPCVCGGTILRDIKCSREGLCDEVCKNLLECGHLCNVRCHPPGPCRNDGAIGCLLYTSPSPRDQA